MKYFTPETSKKLEEMGLLVHNERTPIVDGRYIAPPLFDTLDICELENAKKLWGEEVYDTYRKMNDGHTIQTTKRRDDRDMEGYSWVCWGKAYERKLNEYITLSDEERVKYVEDYLGII